MDNVLSPDDLAFFYQWGYVRITDALPASFVARVQDAIWNQLEAKQGVRRDDPATWHTWWMGMKKEVIDVRAKTEVSERLTGAVNQLLGEGQWRPLKTLGGLLMTMPDKSKPWERVFDWHFDNDPRQYQDGITELMLFTFYSSVEPRGGGTLILAGSPRLVEKYMAERFQEGTPDGLPRTDEMAKWHPWLMELMGSKRANRAIGIELPRSTPELMQETPDIHGVTLRIEELTGEPGDAILCHPAMLHAVSANCSDRPRIMRRTNFRRMR
jgi:hypothetical protein